MTMKLIGFPGCSPSLGYGFALAPRGSAAAAIVFDGGRWWLPAASATISTCSRIGDSLISASTSWGIWSNRDRLLMAAACHAGDSCVPAFRCMVAIRRLIWGLYHRVKILYGLCHANDDDVASGARVLQGFVVLLHSPD